MRSWKFWLGLVISVIFLGLAMRGLDLEGFWQTLQEANYWWLLPGIGVYFLAVLVRSWRWHYMLRHIKPIPPLRLFPTVVIGYMGNNVYPARAGEVLRCYMLRRKEGIAISASLTTTILERIFDGLALLVFILLTLPFAPLPPVYRTFVIVFSAVFCVAIVGFFIVASRPERIRFLYTWVVDRLLPEAVRPRVHSLFDRVVEALQFLRSPRDMAFVFASSIVGWLIETTKYWLIMHAFPMKVSFAVLMLMTAVVNLFTTIPSSPGYVGTFDAPGIAILTQFQVDHAVATGYTLVLHVALWLPITLLGAWYMLRESMDWKEIEQTARERETLSK